MKPIDFESSTETLHGHNEKVGSLPVYIGQGLIISRWRVESFRERLSLLWHGKIWIAIVGTEQPPIAITGFQDAEFIHPYKA